MTEFKVGDRVRRVAGSAPWAPIDFEATVEDRGRGLCYTDNKGAVTYIVCHQWELVESSPVRTVTRREVVEGQYGIVTVDRHKDQVVITITAERGWNPSANDLRSAAMILSQLAEAREDQK